MEVNDCTHGSELYSTRTKPMHMMSCDALVLHVTFPAKITTWVNSAFTLREFKVQCAMCLASGVLQARAWERGYHALIRLSAHSE